MTEHILIMTGFVLFLIFSDYRLIRTLQTFFGRTYFNSDTFHFSFLFFSDSRFPDSAGRAAAGAGCTQSFKSQLDLSPNTSRDQTRRKEPGALA